MKLTLLGTGVPIPDLRRRGPGQIIESGGDLTLVDCGAGTLHRLLEAGYVAPPLKRIAFTHLHSDHITGLPDVLWAGWIRNWWNVPPVISGPPGTAQFVERLISAFEYDIKVRTGYERTVESLIPAVEEVEEGWAVEGSDWRLKAFRVDHMPVDEAFGFRMDSSDGSVVISGDTCYSENLISHSQDADILVHEAYWARGMREALESLSEGALGRQRVIARYHTPSDQIGKIAAEANARHLVMSHLIMRDCTPAEMAADAQADYKGRITVGEDLQVFELRR
jgi:ribonuclease Z